MIDSIGSAGAYRPPPPPSGSANTELSEDQTSLIEETLSGYDSESLSAEDASSIVSAFSEAGINPSAQFADLLAESGFDANEIGTLARETEVGQSEGQRPPPPPPPESSQSTDLGSIVSYLDELTDSGTDSSVTAETLTAMLTQQFGLSDGQSLINVTA